MSALFRIDDIPRSDLVDVLRDAVGRTWVPMDVLPEFHRRDYGGAFRSSGMGPMQVTAIDVPPATLVRAQRHIRQADPQMMKLLLVRDGSCVVEQDDRQVALAPGEFTIYDTRRPFRGIFATGRSGQLQAVTFMFPPALLPLPQRRLRELTALRFGADSGLGEVTVQFLVQLARNIEHYSPAEAARLSTAALEVLATRLVRELDASGGWDTPEARRHALLTTVQSFIQQHLNEPALAPAMIAAAHHISLRSLHQLFHDEGLTVAGWIRQRRLECCRRDLCDPALAARPVAAIAARWGFASPGDFSRVFRAVHGLPPAEYRMSALTVKAPAR